MLRLEQCNFIVSMMVKSKVNIVRCFSCTDEIDPQFKISGETPYYQRKNFHPKWKFFHLLNPV